MFTRLDPWDGMRSIGSAMVLAALLAGCGDTTFSANDALGVWDLQQLNDDSVPGDRTVGVWVRNAGGDSAKLPLQSFSLEFGPGSRCSWTVYDGFSSRVTQPDCQYSVSAGGTVSLELRGFFGADRAVTGKGRRGVLTLVDQHTNELTIRKRP
jgi:hypothetical protein